MGLIILHFMTGIMTDCLICLSIQLILKTQELSTNRHLPQVVKTRHYSKTKQSPNLVIYLSGGLILTMTGLLTYSREVRMGRLFIKHYLQTAIVLSLLP